MTTPAATISRWSTISTIRPPTPKTISISSSRFTAKDSDGDTVSGTFSVVADDDAPVLTAPVAHPVGERRRLWQPPILNIAWGADNADNDALIGATGDRIVTFNAAQPDLAGLTSNGLAVHFVLLSNGTTLVGYTGAVVPTATNSAGVVFYATLNDDNAGSYNFTLVGNIANAADGHHLRLHRQGFRRRHRDRNLHGGRRRSAGRRSERASADGNNNTVSYPHWRL